MYCIGTLITIPFLSLLFLEQIIAITITMVVLVNRRTTNTPPADSAMSLTCKPAKRIIIGMKNLIVTLDSHIT